MRPIPPADIRWQGAQAVARDYDDIYFSHDAAAEVARVFVAPTHLDELSEQQPLVTIGEMGFGTGLNFAVCAAALRCRLHFISFEAHPLRASDWQRSAAAHRAQSNASYCEWLDALAAHPLPLLSGWQRRTFDQGRVTLSVFHGPAEQGLAQLVGQQRQSVDAWFLDGFAPDKNPAMWQPALLAQLGQVSRLGTTVATFTAAGRVRRALQAAGFEMRRVDQRPLKRESLAGVMQADAAGLEATFTPPSQVRIHGAGIGGAMLARHLAEQDIAVQVYDPNGIASGGSSIGTAVMHGRLLGDGSASADLRAAAYLYAGHRTTAVQPTERPGVLQLCDADNTHRFQRIAEQYDAANPDQFWLQLLSAANIRDQFGIDQQQPGLWFPDAHPVQLPELCNSLLDHPQIEFIEKAGALSETNADILCTGTQCRSFPGCDWLEVADVGGQLDTLNTRLPTNTPTVVGQGYLVPTASGAVIGSTYEYKPWEPETATEHNLQHNQRYLPAAYNWHSRQRAARAVTSDRLPFVGQLQPNLWIATGFGSMGTTYAPFAAAMVQSQLLGWVQPCSEAVRGAVDPMRIARRQARRGTRHR